jgi:hypothetical protein
MTVLTFPTRPLRMAPRVYAGQVYLNGRRINPAQVEDLIAFHAKIAAVTGDWTAHDAWMSARDGINEPPLSAAELEALDCLPNEPKGVA